MLKTNCHDCIFKIPKADIHDCLISHKVFFDDDGYQYVEGYCRNKRTKQWSKQFNLTDIELFDKTVEEESQLTAIVSNLDNSIDKLLTTLESLKHPLIKEIIIVVKKPDKITLQSMLEAALNFGTLWHIDNLTGDYDYGSDDSIDYSSRLVSRNWLVSLQAGDTLNSNHLDAVSEYLSKNNTYVAFYNDKFTYINKFAFYELGCNYQCPIIEKIKQCTNWEKVCVKLD